MPDPFEDLDRDQTVRVLPRHLAGPGSVDFRAIWPFPFDDDWYLHQPSKEEGAVACSPCLRLRTGYVPDPNRRGHMQWITAAHRDPFGPATWQITSDATTPVELLGDVHSELLDLYLEDRHSDKDHLFQFQTSAQEAYVPLLAHGWRHTIKTDGTQTFLAPDALSGMQHQYDRTLSSDLAPSWRIWGGRPANPDWRVQFSPSTPVALVAAFTASLLSTEPLERTVKDIPFFTRHHVSIATTTAKQNKPFPPVATPPPRPAMSRTR
ncbi:DUF317 domain-containing protein [Streptomyces werraensis]|uniref:DUF317 domain-containing protein n=1 Tax=Streptomyces werraensis TaxID=68284 RepID=UPI0034183602